MSCKTFVMVFVTLTTLVSVTSSLAVTAEKKESSPPQIPSRDDRSSHHLMTGEEENVPPAEGGVTHGGSGGGGDVPAVEFQWTVILFAVIFVVVSLFAIGCGIFMLCKKDDGVDTGPGYSVAVSNRLFKVSSFSYVLKKRFCN